MQIDTNILITWGAVAKKYKKNYTIFNEDSHSLFYYQILEGQVKMINLHNDGNEYIQGIFHDGSCFGEPPLFIDKPYPASAVAQKDSVILILSKDNFLKLLEEYPNIQLDFIKTLSTRLYNKSVTARELIHNSPEDKLLGFLKSNIKPKKSTEKILVQHTRQEIANLTGLRVETVIRTLKKMEANGIVEIKERKLYY